MSTILTTSTLPETRQQIFARIGNGDLLARELTDRIADLPDRAIEWPPSFSEWFKEVSNNWRAVMIRHEDGRLNG